MYIFESRTKSRIFFVTPFDLFKDKSFYLLEETMTPFENLKGQKKKKLLKIS